jgi:hypothetical protein
MNALFNKALQPNASHGPLIIEVSKSHTTTRQVRQDSSGRVISSLHTPLLENTQHFQATYIHDPDAIRTQIPVSERSQTHIFCNYTSVNK